MKGIPDGDRVAFTNGGALFQRTDTTITKGHSYTLTVGVGGRCNDLGGKYAIRLVAGNTHLAATTGTIPKGGWTEVTVTYSSPANDPHAGKPLTVRLENQGRKQVDFDDVRMDVAKYKSIKTVLFGDLSILGLDHLPLSDVKKTGTTISAKTKLRGEAITIVGFKHAGVSKPYVAVIPADFKLASFLPIPRGSPIDGTTFKDMAFVYVPKGHAQSRIAATAFPTAVRKAISHLGSNDSLREGLNLFGQADFTSSDAIKKVLFAVGHTQLTLPLGGAFSADVFKHNLKTASRKLKEELLVGLHFNLPLPRLTVPGMPRIVSVNNAHLVIVGREVKGKRKIFAGVTGGVDVKVNGTKKAFSFGILAGDPGKQWKATITGESKDKITLPFFKPLDLTGMSWVAKRKDGKWDVAVNAKAKLNNKTVDVAVHHDPKDGDSAVVTAKIKLADLLPGGLSIPGLTDVEFDRLDVNRDFVQVTGKIKKLDTVVAVFKRNGKTYIAVNNPRPIKISSLVSAAKSTPLDDASFQHMTYIWAPKGGAETGMELSALPSDIAYNVKQVVKKVDLKVGLNVIGRMEITKTSKFGKLLTKVGAFKKGLPLVGKLSPKIFHPGSGSSIKNEILDHLNIKMSLPTLKIPGVDKFVTFTGGHMTIKGKSPKGVRGIYFDFGGDAKMSGHGSLEVDVEFDRTAGGKTDFWVTAAGPVKMSSVPGIKDIPNAGKFELDTLKISKHGIEANTKLGGKAVDIALFTGLGWNAAITQKNFSLTELIPGLSHTPLKHISFPSASIIISKEGINKHFGDLSPIAQYALKAIYSKPGDFVQLPKGLTFMAGFHPKNAGAMKKAVKSIGVHDEIMLQGTIGGMFGGTPLVKLKGSLKAGKSASMPKFMKFAKDVDADFFLTVLKSG